MPRSAKRAQPNASFARCRLPSTNRPTPATSKPSPAHPVTQPDAIHCGRQTTRRLVWSRMACLVAELPNCGPLSFRADRGGNLIASREIADGFEGLAVDRHRLFNAVIFVPIEDEHVGLLPADRLSEDMTGNGVLQPRI